MSRQIDEMALQQLETATVDHLKWLKGIHAALLFGEACDPRPVEIPVLLKQWVETPEVSPTIARERDAGYARLHWARQLMASRAAQLLQQAAQGPAVAPEDYHAFMAGVEAYGCSLHRLEAMLRQSLAETDPLTGVNNRLGMRRDLEREWQRAVRTGQPCCIALVDLDHFKRINDRFGHAAGDAVLSQVADFFVRRLRPYDRVYRYGGEEFLFVLPNADAARAQRILDRLRTRMARLPMTLHNGISLQITCSIGLADMSSPETPPDVAVEMADAAVYMAKDSGRNRVCVACDYDDIDIEQPGASEADEVRDIGFTVHMPTPRELRG